MTDEPRTFGKFDRDPEALAWARTMVQAYIDMLTDYEKEAQERGATAKGLGFQAARLLAQRHLLGNGCFIGAFDERRPAVAQAMDQPGITVTTTMAVNVTGTPEQLRAAGEQFGRALRRNRFDEEG